jgi:hypothetical protein
LANQVNLFISPQTLNVTKANGVGNWKQYK